MDEIAQRIKALGKEVSRGSSAQPVDVLPAEHSDAIKFKYFFSNGNTKVVELPDMTTPNPSVMLSVKSGNAKNKTLVATIQAEQGFSPVDPDEFTAAHIDSFRSFKRCFKQIAKGGNEVAHHAFMAIQDLEDEKFSGPHKITTLATMPIGAYVDLLEKLGLAKRKADHLRTAHLPSKKQQPVTPKHQPVTPKHQPVTHKHQPHNVKTKLTKEQKEQKKQIFEAFDQLPVPVGARIIGALAMKMGDRLKDCTL